MSLANEPVLIAALPVADRTVVSPFGSVSANTLLREAFVNVNVFSWWSLFTLATLLLQQLWILTSVVAAWAIGGPTRKPASTPAAASAMPFQYLRARIESILSSRPRSGLWCLPLLLRRYPRRDSVAVLLRELVSDCFQPGDCRGRDRRARHGYRRPLTRQPDPPAARDKQASKYRCHAGQRHDSPRQPGHGPPSA